MAWWSWLVIGMLLLCAELFAVDLQFYLVFIGIGATITGITVWLIPGLPSWMPWIIFAALSLTSMYTIRRKLYDRIKSRGVGIADSAAGGQVKINEDVAPGHSCRTEYRGSMWTAVNVGDEPIPASAIAVIETVDGLNLRVRLPK